MARRWALPLDRLNGEIGQIVIWDVGGIEQQELNHLRTWVWHGGIALIGGEIGDLEGSIGPVNGESGYSAAAHPVNLGVSKVNVGTARFTGGTDSYLVHLKDDHDHPILVSWSFGEGRIFWSADTEWLTNKRIGNNQNLDLALQILWPASDQQVAFDEYHHGYQTASRWWQILRGQLQLFVALLALAIALLFWAYGARFGSPRPGLPGPQRAAVEYVYSMSQIYRRAQARGLVLKALYRSLTLELGKAIGGVRGLTHAQIAERTAHRAGMRPAAIQNLLDRIGPEHKSLPTETELIRLAREVEELQRRMQNGGYRDQRNPGAGRK